jgi:hypothetical protein
MTLPPAPRPCGSCPYRLDVPSGVWAEEEYAKLPEYDRETGHQPARAFLCHQQDGRLCAGWVGCHDMTHSLGLRLLAFSGALTDDDVDEVLDYQTDVPLFTSGAEAAEHGLLELRQPSEKAARTIQRLSRKVTPHDRME